MKDAQLLAKFVGSQDRDALAILIARYEKLVWSVCSRILNHRADVEDAFQMTFLTFVQKAHRIRKPGSLSNWLYGVARKTALRIRAHKASLVSDSRESLEQVVEESPDILEAIARQYEIDLIDQKLAAMNEKHRTPLVLFYFSRLTAKQIADQLNVSVAAVEGRLRRARQILRQEVCRDGLTVEHGISGLLACGMVQPKGWVALMTKRCVATLASHSTGAATFTLSSGANLMISKSICAIAIVALLALGGVMHAGPWLQTESDAVSQLSNDNLTAEVVSDSEFVAVPENGTPNEDDDSFLERMHHHMIDHHDRLVEHVHAMFHFFHGTESDEN